MHQTVHSIFLLNAIFICQLIFIDFPNVNNLHLLQIWCLIFPSEIIINTYNICAFPFLSIFTAPGICSEGIVSPPFDSEIKFWVQRTMCVPPFVILLQGTRSQCKRLLGSDSPGREFWPKCGPFLTFDKSRALVWPNLMFFGWFFMCPSVSLTP